MKAEKIREWIESLTDDIEFDYKGIHGAICPINSGLIYLSYGDEALEVHSVDEAMEITFINGENLQSISEKIDIN